jgi:hypothetical protein
MSAKDIFHQVVIDALENEEWEITHDPLKIGIGSIEYRIDLGAERVIGASKGNEKIAVEIKSFVGQSKTYELHNAIGQFNNYVVALEEVEPDRKLYLAIPSYIFSGLFQEPIVQKTVNRYKINLVVVDVNKKKIKKWIK